MSTVDVFRALDDEILQETTTIEGVETAVYLDKESKNGQLVEETRDYLAQHKNGDVWYFGEDVNNYSNGMLASSAVEVATAAPGQAATSPAPRPTERRVLRDMLSTASNVWRPVGRV